MVWCGATMEMPMAPIRDVEWAQVANNNINLHLVDFYIYHSMFINMIYCICDISLATKYMFCLNRY